MSGSATANDTGLQRCRGIADAAARLACYDALPLAPVPAARPAPSPTSQAPAARPMPPAAPAASAKPSEDLYPRQTQEQFGMERKAATVELSEIESTISGRFEGFRPNLRIRLANGQVWQVADDTRRLYDKENPRVTVRRGAFGAFYLNLDGDNLTVRVRRVE